MNSLTIVGNLVSDPAKGNLTNGTACNMRVAADRGSGGEQKRTDYVDVEAYGLLAENALQALQSGDRVIITGCLRLDQWEDSDGNKRSKHKVKATTIGRSLEFTA